MRNTQDSQRAGRESWLVVLDCSTFLTYCVMLLIFKVSTGTEMYIELVNGANSLQQTVPTIGEVILFPQPLGVRHLSPYVWILQYLYAARASSPLRPRVC